MSGNPGVSQTLLPPPAHPSRTSSGISSGHSSRSISPAPPLPPRAPSSTTPTPELPPRPREVSSSSVSPFSQPTPEVDEDDDLSADATESGQDGPHEPFEFVQTSDIPSDFLFKSIAEDMPESQLRELYENEEIERFVNFFSAHVSEVRAPTVPNTSAASAALTSPSEVTIGVSQTEDSADGLLDEDEVANAPPVPPSPRATPQSYDSLSETIALKYIVPRLPPSVPPQPPFTLGRFKLAVQRLYMIGDGYYLPLLLRIWQLATWKDKRQSATYCAIFWVLWFFDLLLPSFFLHLLVLLLHRRLVSYPTLAELRKHHTDILRAREFGEEMQMRLITGSVQFGAKDLFRLYKKFKKPKKAKGHEKKGSKKSDSQSTTSLVDDLAADGAGAGEGAPVIDVIGDEEEGVKSTDTDEVRAEKHLKAKGLAMLVELADMHERVKNIFLWRRPEATWVYFGAIAALFIVTLILPARYFQKLVFMTGGFMFWHVVPIVKAIPPADRARLPPPLGNVPTDAEYAMDLISQRVARGLPILPPKSYEPSIRSSDTDSVRSLNVQNREGLRQRFFGDENSKSVDWRKWGERAATTKAWADSVRGESSRRGASGTSTPSVQRDNPTTPVETFTFPATSSKGPGLITVTPTTLYFTPLVAVNPTIVLPTADITGIKKTTMINVKGLVIHWTKDGEERTEKFRWVGGRDEVFARLLGGSGGRRWINV